VLSSSWEGVNDKPPALERLSDVAPRLITPIEVGLGIGVGGSFSFAVLIAGHIGAMIIIVVVCCPEG
jgi:hypothetical protein